MSGITRLYRDTFENQTVAALMDVFSIRASAANGVALRGFSLSAGATAGAIVRVRLKVLPATVTAGSGGASSTPQKTDRKNNIAVGSTVRQRDTTQATTSGTAVTLAVWQWNVLGPLEYIQATPEQRECIDVSEALVLDFVAAPASVSMSAWIEWEEYP